MTEDDKRRCLPSLSDPPHARTNRVLWEVFDERRRQDEKFGDQTTQRDGTYVDGAMMATAAQKACEDERRQWGAPSWAFVLLEEVYEALAEVDPKLLRAELVQVAAVAVAWIEAIDRRGA